MVHLLLRTHSHRNSAQNKINVCFSVHTSLNFIFLSLPSLFAHLDSCDITPFFLLPSFLITIPTEAESCKLLRLPLLVQSEQKRVRCGWRWATKYCARNRTQFCKPCTQNCDRTRVTEPHDAPVAKIAYNDSDCNVTLNH